MERAASSDAYRLLAAHLRSLAGDPSALLDPGVLDTLRAALVETQPWGERAAAAAYQALPDEAERIRLEVAGIARTRARLAHASSIATPAEMAGMLDAARYLEDAIIASAGVLAGVAAALGDGRSAAADPEDRERYRAAIEHLRAIADHIEPSARATVTHAIAGLTALAGQLRSVIQLTAVAAGDQPAASEATASASGPPVRSRARPSALAGTTGGRLELVRANLTLTSEVFRHAIRAGATLAVAVAISHLFPLGHGYWLPMTVMIVLKPDFAATLSRGLGRSVGTLLGAGLVTLLLAALAPSPTGLIVLTVALYAASVAVLRANYVIYSVGIASLVVVLLAFTGSPAASLAADRVFYTILGAFLALAAYVAWPTWERARVADRLANLVEVDGRYGTALLHAWADPASADRGALQRLRLVARLARSNAEASVDRWLSEPAGQQPSSPNALDAETGQGILAAVRRYVWGALVLHGQLPSSGPVRPDLHRLADEAEKAMGAVAVALRTGSTSTDYPPLRATQVALAAHLSGASAEVVADPTSTALDMVVLSETDLMVNSADPEWPTIDLRNAIAAGTVEGPRLVVAAHLIGSTGSHADVSSLYPPRWNLPVSDPADSPDAIRRQVRQEHKYGSDWIKTTNTGGYFSPGDDPARVTWFDQEMQALCNTAAHLGLPVAVHTGAAEGCKQAIRCGARSLEHAYLIDDEAIAMAEDAGTFIVPTMQMTQEDLQALGQGQLTPYTAAKIERDAEQILQSQRRIAASRAKIAFGTDCGMFPFSHGNLEFQAMVKTGLSPARALRAATGTAAELLGRSDIGLLEPGALADIIAMPGDPIDDITLTTSVDFVMIGEQLRRQPPPLR